MSEHVKRTQSVATPRVCSQWIHVVKSLRPVQQAAECLLKVVCNSGLRFLRYVLFVEVCQDGRKDLTEGRIEEH